jgi:DNA-binding transcriptional LysR family regulator
MDRFSAMTVFAQVVESGSFARAAERLGLSTSACSRHVSDLEAHLGSRLLNRTTRRLSLTESGQAFHERTLQLLSDLEEAEQLAAQSTSVPRGTIRLTCSLNFGVRHLAPAMAEFLSRHAQVKFDVSVADRIVDLVEDGYDLAVRIGQVGSTNLVARRLGEMRAVLCASPAYLARHGVPQAPADLARHNCFTYANVAQPGVWRFVDAEGREQSVNIAGNVHANNGDMLCAMAVDGAGIVNEPDFIVGPDVRAGRLVRLLPGWQGLRADIWAVYPSRRHLSAKVRAFVDFLAEYFAGAGDWSCEAAGAAAPALPPALPSAAGTGRRRSAARTPRKTPRNPR